MIQKPESKNLLEYDGDDQVLSAEEISLRFKDQPESIINLRSNIPSLDTAVDGFREGELIVISGPTKQGKCWRSGTKMLMYDGSTRNVEDIRISDLLMGDDSTHRKVESLSNGIGKLYKIAQGNGDSFCVNAEHILVLKRQQGKRWRTDNPKGERRPRKNHKGEIIEISVKEYFSKSKTFKKLHVMYKVPIKLPYTRIRIDPYLLGVWLGDGSKNAMQIETADEEIVNYIYHYANNNGFLVKVKEQLKPSKSKGYRLCEPSNIGRSGSWNRIIDALDAYGLRDNKHIPAPYKFNSTDVRRKILAGLLDTDGHRFKGRNSFEIIQKRKVLADDILFLARSIGFRATMQKPKIIKGKSYHRVILSGDFSVLPCRCKNTNYLPSVKDPLQTEFTIEPIGIGKYFGFAIDGNHRHLLGDFTVTHNTLLAQSLTVQFHKQQYYPLWFSFEVPVRQFLSQFHTMPLIYMPAKLKPHALDWFKERVQESFEKYHTRIIFCDHLHYLIDLARLRNPSIEIGQIIRSLKTLAVEGNFVIFLLCHTSKGATEDNLSFESIRDSSFISQESDSVLMIKRTPDKGETTARLRIEFHRRTGVLEKVIKLIKVNGYLAELEEHEQRNRYGDE